MAVVAAEAATPTMNSPRITTTRTWGIPHVVVDVIVYYASSINKPGARNHRVSTTIVSSSLSSSVGDRFVVISAAAGVLNV